MSELWSAVARAGFIGVNIPEEYGGGGMGILELSIVGEELAAAGCPALLMVVSPAICGSVIAKHGTDEQKRTWLPKIAGAEDPSYKMAFAITEPDAGSNSHKISTTATRDGDEYILRGTKYYISGVDEAQQMLVVTRTGVDENSGRGKLSLFVVDTDAPGLEQTVIPMEILAPDKQYTLFFDEVRVPADRLIGAEHEGLRQVFTGLNPERVMGAAQGNGIARYALDKAASLRPRPPGVGRPHRHAPGPLPPAGHGQDRGRAGPAHDPEGRLALRPRRRRRRGGQHGQVRLGRGVAQGASTRPSRPTAATAWPPSTAWPRCGAWSACSARPPSAAKWC